MKSQQSGFTLVEIAIVLVIIGLLLGGILKGQELINSAKVKNLANDFRVIPTYIYAYQDKFKAIPGDDSAAAAHMSGCTGTCANGNGNGLINGPWKPTAATDETQQFWAHVRIANLAAGPTTWTAVNVGDPFTPKNAVGGQLGVSSATSGQVQIANMTGTYQICSAGILGKFAKQLDVQMDDGDTTTGSMRAVPDGSALNFAAAAISAAAESDPYTVCLTF
jgi:prepilin-type N-terminal cleavage/methylation domain-containing protein